VDRPLRRTTLRDGIKDRIVEWRSLRVEARTLISVIRADSDLRMIAEMHRPVLQALQSRDPELAGKEMRAHIEFFGSFVTRRPDDHD
jgi:DNA-binding FadR family transcriptional regulator